MLPVNRLPCRGIRIPEAGKVLLVESRIQCFGISNTAQGIGDPNQVPLAKTGIQYLKPGIHSLES